MLQAVLDIDLESRSRLGSSTQGTHLLAVEEVIRTMHERLREPLSLEDMADVACLSPYYFNRVFHTVVGIPPGEFLATLRLEEAKRLLLTTRLNVTDVCFEVGYTGLGSFTTRFTQLVGMPPRHLRSLAQHAPIFASLPTSEITKFPPRPFEYAVRGRIHTIEPFHGVVFVGLFPKPIPQGRIVRGTRLVGPGPFVLERVPAGRYFLLVAAMPFSDNPQTYLLPDARSRVGVQGPLLVGEGDEQEPIEMVLRPWRITDPPLITALPYAASIRALR